MNNSNASQSMFSVYVILLIPIAIAINVVGSFLSTALKLPIFLDMIGVILLGALAGPIPAAVAGLLTNLVIGIFDPVWIPYALVAIAIGIASGLLSRCNMMNGIFKLFVSGVVIAIVSTVTDAPITVYLYGGVNGAGTSVLIAGLMASGMRILQSVLSVTIVIELISKIISVFAAYIIIRAMPDRSLLKFRFGSKFIRG